MHKHTLILISLIPLLFGAGCAHPSKKTGYHAGSTARVRTTAYAACEGSSRNAIGGRLSYAAVKSAASDWSRFPLGTKFKIVSTGDVYQIDDYGSALVGTNTIDLFKPSRGSMRSWGVKHVDIQILEWGNREKSLQVLAPRAGIRHVRPMVASLRQQTKARPDAGQASRLASSRRPVVAL